MPCRFSIFCIIADVEVELQRKLIRQPVLWVLHQRLYIITPLRTQHILLTIKRCDLNRSFIHIPFRRKLAHLLISKIVLKEHFVATYEIALGICTLWCLFDFRTCIASGIACLRLLGATFCAEFALLSFSATCRACP